MALSYEMTFLTIKRSIDSKPQESIGFQKTHIIIIIIIVILTLSISLL